MKSMYSGVALAALLASLAPLHPSAPAAVPPRAVDSSSAPTPHTTPDGREIVIGVREADRVCTLIDVRSPARAGRTRSSTTGSSIEDIDATFEGNLYEAITRHHTSGEQ